MTEGERSNPFALIDQLNAGRAARDVETDGYYGVDQARVKRDAERRERLGQLRAREHQGKRPNGGVHQFFS